MMLANIEETEVSAYAKKRPGKLLFKSPMMKKWPKNFAGFGTFNRSDKTKSQRVIAPIVTRPAAT
jgi:hypothetical protein